MSSDKGKKLFNSEIDLVMGTSWPKGGHIKLSSHDGKAVVKEFDTLDDFMEFCNSGFAMEDWIDDRVREHWPNSDYAKALAV